MQPISVSIILVCYNTRELILRCLSSIYEKVKGFNFEVIVFDNNSQDGSADAIEAQYPQVKLIRSTRNLGFGAGNNRASEQANGRYLLLLNPDTLVKNGTIETLVEYAENHPEGGAWGGVCELPDGSVDPGCRQILPGIKSRFKDLFCIASRAVAHMDRNEDFEGEVQVLSGAFMMLRTNVWRELGGFDESFKLYSEDTDLCYRMHKAGYKVLMTGKSRIIHNSGSGELDNPKQTLNMVRGAMHFYRKHYSVLGATIAGILIWLFILRQIVGSYMLQPFVQSDRCISVRRRFSQVAFCPGEWWYGWKERKL